MQRIENCVKRERKEVLQDKEIQGINAQEK